MAAVCSSMVAMCSGAWLRPPDCCACSVGVVGGASRRAYETKVANERKTPGIPENPQGPLYSEAGLLACAGLSVPLFGERSSPLGLRPAGGSAQSTGRWLDLQLAHLVQQRLVV